MRILLNAATRRDTHGTAIGVVGVGQDITKLRLAMEETAHVADDLTRLIDTANAPIFGIDVNGNVTEWNRTATETSGWPKENTIGHPLVSEFITMEYQEEVGRVLNMALQGYETSPLCSRAPEISMATFRSGNYQQH